MHQFAYGVHANKQMIKILTSNISRRTSLVYLIQFGNDPPSPPARLLCSIRFAGVADFSQSAGEKLVSRKLLKLLSCLSKLVCCLSVSYTHLTLPTILRV